MGPSERAHILRELGPLDRENLALGRLTSWAVGEAARRARESGEGFSGAGRISDCWRVLADELNDMVKAARDEERLAAKLCWACGGLADGHTGADGRPWSVVCMSESRSSEHAAHVER